MPGWDSRGLNGAAMRERHFNALMAAPLVGSCDFCDWTAEGLAGDVIAAQKKHRAKHGLEKWSFKRATGVRNLTHFRQVQMSEEEQAEIDASVALRRKLHGLEEVAA